MKAPRARRRRSLIGRMLFPLLPLAVVVTACGSVATSEAIRPATPTTTATAEPANPAPTATSEPAATNAPATPPATPTAIPTPHPLVEADTELPPAPVGFDDLFETASGPHPISIAIENIGVDEAAVIAVGVNEDLTFEVPPADQVGWYEFGPAPGEPGSAVLAAHIAYNGVDGVFRYLEDVEVGSVVTVGFDDGTSQRYRITEVQEYIKEALPDSLFARDGDQQLALITCGGTFNEQLASYESNTVAIAIPV